VPALALRTLVLLLLAGYTAFAAGPFVWVATMSLRTTTEITADPYGLPWPMHWDKYAQAWFGSNYDTYFWNSTIVTVSAVAALSILGAMAAYCLARYRFPAIACCSS
jgi:ABC-type glycerol-3-phosphate transport system permease component